MRYVWVHEFWSFQREWIIVPWHRRAFCDVRFGGGSEFMQLYWYSLFTEIRNSELRSYRWYGDMVTCVARRNNCRKQWGGWVFVCLHDLLTRGNQINSVRSGCSFLLSALVDSFPRGFVVWFLKDPGWNFEILVFSDVSCTVPYRIGLDAFVTNINLSPVQLMKSGVRQMCVLAYTEDMHVWRSIVTRPHNSCCGGEAAMPCVCVCVLLSCMSLNNVKILTVA